MELINVEVQDVEVVGPLTQAIKHQHVIGNRIADPRVEAERPRHAGNEIGCGDRIAACEQRNLVAEAYQLLRQI